MQETGDELLWDEPARTQTRPSQTRRKLLALFGTLLLILIGLRFILPRMRTPRETGGSFVTPVSSTPLPKTGTFVDDQFGTVLLFEGETLVELKLPDRTRTRIIDTTGQEEFPVIAPAWSPDGALLALVKDDKTVSITRYTTGEFVSMATVSGILSKEHTYLSFSPFSDVIAVGTDKPNLSESFVTFIDVGTGAVMGSYTGCTAKGVWLTDEGYMSECAVADTSVVVLIRFTQESSHMVTVARSTSSTQYDVFVPYDGSRAVVVKKSGNREELGTLAATGQFAPLSARDRQGLPDIAALRDPFQALARRIEEKTGIKNIDHVSVSSDNTWVVFSREAETYVVDLRLEKEPFLLGNGSKPQIRPY